MRLAVLKRWLFAPFIYIGGGEAFVLGWLIILGTACLAWMNNTHFDGVLDVHKPRGGGMPFYIYLIEQVIAWSCTVLVFYPIGLIMTRNHIRSLNVMGTMALARWPMLFSAFIGFFYVPPHDLFSLIINKVLVKFLFVALTVWMVVIMYHAFRASTTLKKERANSGFAIGLVISELISKIIFFQVNQHFLTN